MPRAEIRILIASSERLVCETLSAALKATGLSVVAEVHDGVSAVERIDAEVPDVAVVSIDLLRLGGSGAIDQLIGGDAAPLLVVFGARYTDLLLARGAGASGFLSNSATLEQLIEAIRALAAGRSYFPPDVSGSDLGHTPAQARRVRTGITALTNREREVLTLIAEGMSSRQIAVACHISVRTVHSHRRSLMTKLEVRGLSALVRIAVREGIVDPKK